MPRLEGTSHTLVLFRVITQANAVQEVANEKQPTMDQRANNEKPSIGARITNFWKRVQRSDAKRLKDKGPVSKIATNVMHVMI